MRWIWRALSLGALLLPVLGHAGDMRCGRQLVTESDTQSSLLAKCGEPTRKSTRNQSWTPPKSANVVRFHKKIEEWTYNRGPREFVQIVRFEDGKIVSMSSGGYGW